MKAVRVALVACLALVAGATIMAWLGSGVAAQAQPPAASTRPTARFVALQPAAAGENTLQNFLWVLDAATGEVVAYRIASVKDDAGKHDLWMTERLLTEEEYGRSLKKKDNAIIK